MRSKTPLVSVVMPAYNAEKYISEAIESVLNQTFKDFEFIIIDDASTDRSFEIIKKYESLDSRISVLSNPENLNVARSRNRGISISKGKYVANMDADDISKPTRINDQVNYLELNQDVDICIGNIGVIDGEGRFQYTRIYPLTDSALKSKVFRYNPFPNPTIFCRKYVYEKIGGYDSSFILNEDFDFWLRAGTQFKFGNCGKIVLDYRVVEGSASHKKLRLTERLTFKLRLKAIKLGYKFTIGDLFFNLFHFISYLLLPSGLKIKLFDLLRKNKII